MQCLNELIASILEQTTFDMGRTEITHDLRIITHYSSRQEEIISPVQLREIYERNRWSDEEDDSARRAHLIVPEQLMSQLADQLRLFLEEYINPETDRIGHAVPINGTTTSGRSSVRKDRSLHTEYVSSVDDFAKGIIKGAAVLGVERIAHLLSQWRLGEPLAYRRSTIVNGLTVNEPFSPREDIHIEPLPLSTDQLPAYLPTRRGVSQEDYLGRTVLSLGVSQSPPLFRPSTTPAEQTTNTRQAIDFDTVCQALSLEVNNHLDESFFWNDYQELGAFSLSNATESWAIGTRRLAGRPWGSMNFNFDTGVHTLVPEDQSPRSIDVEQLCHTLRALEGQNDKMRVAVARWRKSKDSSVPVADRFIDLRIALEALYLRDFLNEQSQEMRFRLALFGAWHLGTDLEERRRIRKSLRDAYDVASSAVHLGKVDHAREQTLSDGQDLCRRGILKLIKEGEPRNWSDLILGSDLSN